MLFEKLFKSPPVWLLILIYVLTVISTVASVVMVVVGYEGYLCYIVYAIAAIALAYSIYTMIRMRGRIRDSVGMLIYKSPLASRYVSDHGFRALVGAVMSLALNILFGVFNGVMGIMSSSYWYGSLALYYILLAVIYGVILFDRKNDSYKSYRRSGIILSLLNVVLSIAIAQMIFESRAFEYAGLMIYAFAAFAFYKLTMAIIQAVKSRKRRGAGIRALAFINLCSGMVSILALQTALLAAFGEAGADNSLFNTLTGSAVSLSLIGISIFMIINGTKKMKLEKTNER